MSWRSRIATLWYAALAVTAVLAFATPLLTSPTDENPTGDAGLSAPVVALCTAALILSQAMSAGGLQIRRLPSIGIGLGSVASAYLWMADEAGTHPLDPRLPIFIGVLLAFAALMTLMTLFPLIALKSKPRPNDQPSSEDSSCQ